ncbi:hypothetical protein B6N60_00045 [Richelia sinica FACHB-800]|uniref:Uncharacterized protein n=1 Tax=Richelia sinica FACHB-800 TaxID=1357546 RepID=A0A975T4Q8_9NOST|nr:hypothetical protein B6N60_00045 [Richelia sinica FACHB-800]
MVNQIRFDNLPAIYHIFDCIDYLFRNIQDFTSDKDLTFGN